MNDMQKTRRIQSRETMDRSPRFTSGDGWFGGIDATTAHAADTGVTLFDAVREMLMLAIEGAFDLRVGRQQSPHLRRFEDVLNTQMEVLDTLENGVFAPDPALLTRRAQEALHGFAATVRHEIVDDVRPGMSPTVFDAALRRMTERAVMVGAAFASLDLVLQQL